MNELPLPSQLAALWRLLPRRRGLQFGALCVLMLAGAAAEVVSLGAVLPFLAVIATPDQVLAHPLGGRLAALLGVTEGRDLLLPATAVFVAAAIGSAVLRLLLIWSSSRLSMMSGSDIGHALYRRALYQSYEAHLRQHTSEVIAGITSKSEALVHGVIQAALLLVTSAFLACAVIGALLWVDPGVALVSASCFGVAYWGLAALSRNRIRRNSEEIARNYPAIVRAIQEGLGGIRDVLLDGTQSTYLAVYRRADLPFRRAMTENTLLAACPRYLMEAFGMVFIAALAFFLTRGGASLGTVLPMLGALALGAQRLLPALQQGYSAWVALSSNRAILAETLVILEDARAIQPEIEEAAPLPFEREITMRDVRFRYEGSSGWVIDELCLAIPKGARVGIVGTSGSGKTTTVDLIMGLLAPGEGAVQVDGVRLSSTNVRNWQRSIAHVPQFIFLSDNSVAENIAFGVPRDRIDMDRVRDAARGAHLAEFIATMPGGYATEVGERGIRLSGGQRQRIGIARALYKQAPVLIFDEATSSLDAGTEASIMESIESLGREHTMVIIAHRLSTVRHCDFIVELERGRCVATGRYEDLIERSPGFRRLASATREHVE